MLKDMSASWVSAMMFRSSTRISSRAAAPGAILQEAKRNYAMIVMGVSVRPGEDLFFGNTVTAVLKECPKGPILMIGVLVSSGNPANAG